jgi:hypothetical protein
LLLATPRLIQPCTYVTKGPWCDIVLSCINQYSNSLCVTFILNVCLAWSTCSCSGEFYGQYVIHVRLSLMYTAVLVSDNYTVCGCTCTCVSVTILWYIMFPASCLFSVASYKIFP